MISLYDVTRGIFFLPQIPPTIMTMFDKPMVYHDPYGVILVMGAWNYPLQLALLPVSGNSAHNDNCITQAPVFLLLLLVIIIILIIILILYLLFILFCSSLVIFPPPIPFFCMFLYLLHF